MAIKRIADLPFLFAETLDNSNPCLRGAATQAVFLYGGLMSAKK
jgi:hypothetical protein